MQVNTLLSTLHHRAGLALYPDAEAEAWNGNIQEEAEAYSDAHPGRIMMWRRFKEYLIWKSDLGALGRNNSRSSNPKPTDLPPGPLAAGSLAAGGRPAGPMAEALKHKYTSGHAPPTKRRRVRGGASAQASATASAQPASHGEMVAKEADELENLCVHILCLRCRCTVLCCRSHWPGRP